mmetsp:Transcript_7498/g.21210  ORF Transcript_7498/g.21210 Transcript_7498/m.21210 type:complete len:600 (-) Transcript_7498:279-2078(-)|eukprot:CAMPEP_0117671258 /NCGR_PEP_ID=MMETSP0804-20121206/13228_1 /TAXON_ID=1074897 /ORGANISM="Tetraselmis astigmatica, Strain CCMP880" /LENGTH=599 /DNA_ID=CAMNT_0005479687 /DNA_START=147 /DNA_END=1946 /DNA_ORIENTATION=-
MDPDMAKLAMEKMSKMTPDQMARMQAQMANISPETMQAAMAQMNSMSAADKEALRQRMSNMDASQMEEMRAAQQTHLRNQQQYQYQASVMLKNEGNTLNQQQRYKEAAEKYQLAYSNMAGHTSAEGKELRKASALNLSLMHLKLGENKAVIPLCSEVLTSDSCNIKALYRRGQAHSALGALEEAAADLQAAHTASPADAAIKGKLDEVTAELKAKGKSLPPPAAIHMASPAPAAPNSAAAPDPAMAASMLKDANTRKMMADMMRNMSDDDIRRMAQMSGAPPGMSIEDMRKQYEMLDSMDETQVNEMCGMSARFARGANVPGPPAEMLNNPNKLKAMHDMMSSNPEMMQKMMESVSTMPEEQLAAMAQAAGAPAGVKLTPDMMKMSMEMMSKMSPEDLEMMRKMQAGAGAGPAAPAVAAPSAAASTSRAPVADVEIEDITPPAVAPDMASMAAKMMGGMSPEDMQRMSQMAGSMGGMGGMGPAGMTTEQQAKMQQEMMSNPETMKMMQNMMQSMDPATLAALSKQAGMEISEQQAAQMADAMKKIKPEHMEKLMKVAGYAQKAKQKAVEAKDFLFSRSMFWISLAMLLLAMMMRYFGLV